MSPKIVFKEESYNIIGACFEVYKDKGNGFLEAVYQECVSIEFEHLKIPFIEQPTLELFYRDKKLSQRYEPDFICYSEIIIELKAVKNLNDAHRAQLHNYLKATNKKLGLLINFGHHPGLEYERILN